MLITLDRRPMGTYSFWVSHTSLGCTLCTETQVTRIWVGVYIQINDSGLRKQLDFTGAYRKVTLCNRNTR